MTDKVDDGRVRPVLRDYVALARPDHWIKNVLIVPGIALALVLHGKGLSGLLAIGKPTVRPHT